jgi:streptogramin lyase
LGFDPLGNWIVHDSPTVLRINRSEELTAEFRPTYADGRTFHLPDGLRAAPDGSLWGSDSFALVRLDGTGIVDHVIGDPPSEVQLGDVGSAFIDHTGRILMADQRTNAVHVFDSQGQHLAVCKLDPKTGPHSASLAVAPDLTIHVGSHKFAPNSVRLGHQFFQGVNLFQPASGKRWEVYESVIRLIAEDGTELKQLTRTPDDRWLGLSEDCAVAADGTLVLSTRGRYHLFSPDGEPVRSLEISAPGGNLALSRSHVFAVSSRYVWRTDLETGAIQRVEHGLEDAEQAWPIPAWREELGELWLANPLAKKVLRYRVK